jgi:exopolyphosphatase / guanosine-5'-triphosphate,3'-diphosphate pyrophosphatase
LRWSEKRKLLELVLTEQGRGLFGEVAQSRFQSLSVAMRAQTKITIETA